MVDQYQMPNSETIITSNVGAMGVNTTSTMHTASSDIDYNNGYKQHDVTTTVTTNDWTVNNLSASEVCRIVCMWIVFVVGVVGNLLMLIMVIWKRTRKQVKVE